MGGAGSAFPETAWSSILSRGDPSSPERREKIERLCSRYWKPVYSFIRSFRSVGIEDAKDLTQAFFCHLLEGDLVARYQPDRGRFRSYLKGALRIFLAEAYRDGQARKRGGGREIVSLDVSTLETRRFVADLRQLSPDDLFDLHWRREVMGQAIERLQDALREEGKEEYYRVYAAYDLVPTDGEKKTYESVARSLNLPFTDVKNYLTYARSRLRELVLEGVTEYAATSDDLLQEMRELFERG